jgi:predicted enzyme related to lactoylglutathione lyase
MGERTSYTSGTFSWADLTTTDQDGARRFYTQLFGWEYDDSPAGEGVVYSMAKLGGHFVAAISPQPQQQREAGVPPAWNSYVTVEDADRTLDRARELGGNVHAGAFDVFDSGRMGVVQDPQGAFFLIWEPKQHIGAGLVNAPGALAWNELGTPAREAAAAFYRDLFGWKTSAMPGADPPYLIIHTADGHSNGGIRDPAPPGTPPFWLVYFATEDLEDALEKVRAGGGQVLLGATDIGIAKIAVATDPQGAVFALYDGRLDD